MAGTVVPFSLLPDDHEEMDSASSGDDLGMLGTPHPLPHPSGMAMTELSVRSTRLKRPFTPSQWVELEHQALICNYLNQRAPTPSRLLPPLSKGFSASGFFPPTAHHNLSNRSVWGSLHQGTRMDLGEEPGRCRRTDGKKWRCTKDAVANHKYCERHINRNRHRSRKPVEAQYGQPVAAGDATASVITPAKLQKASFWEEDPSLQPFNRDRTKVGDNLPLLPSADRSFASNFFKLSEPDTKLKFSTNPPNPNHLAWSKCLAKTDHSHGRANGSSGIIALQGVPVCSSELSLALPSTSARELLQQHSPEPPWSSVPSTAAAEGWEDASNGPAPWGASFGGPLGEILSNASAAGDMHCIKNYLC